MDELPPPPPPPASSLSVPQGAFGHLSSAVCSETGTLPAAPVLAVAFDHREELLWTGTAVGRLSSHYSPALSKHTAWQPAGAERPEVRQLDASMDACVLALYADALRACGRTGVPLFTHKFGPTAEMSSMVGCKDDGTHVMVAGYGKTAVRFDVACGKAVAAIDLDSDCALMCTNDRWLFCADSTGRVVMRDTRTLAPAHTFEAHKGAVSDMDSRGPLLVTAGCSYQSYLGQAPALGSDRFLMVYDVRVMRAQTPVATVFEPAFVRFVPTYSDRRLLVASQAGDFQVFELGESSLLPYRVDTGGAPLYAVDVSPTRQCIVFADGAGCAHLFTDRINAAFNEHSWPTVFADASPPLPAMRVDDALAPLAVIPTPFPAAGHSGYFSDMRPDYCAISYREPEEIGEEVLSSMRQIDFVGYAQNVHGRLPNQIT